jgi:hypothetical protein
MGAHRECARSAPAAPPKVAASSLAAGRTATISYSLALRSKGSALLLMRYVCDLTSSAGSTRVTSKRPLGLGNGVTLASKSTICPIAYLCGVMTWRLAEKKKRKKGQEQS